MFVRFDDRSAELLVAVLGEAADVLRSQSAARMGAARGLMCEFRGVYAGVVEQGCLQEAADRGRLIGVLLDLADQVVVVARRAEEERQRRRALREWQEREDKRRQARNHAFITGGVVPDFAALDVHDPKPSEFQIRPPGPYAVFRPHPRPRSAPMSNAGGVSSADPDEMMRFVATWRGCDQRIDGVLTRVRNSWLRFTAECEWAQIDHVNLPFGFQELREEGEYWISWVRQIAVVFYTAGSVGPLGFESTATFDPTGRHIASLGDETLNGLLPAATAMLSPSTDMQGWRLTEKLLYQLRVVRSFSLQYPELAATLNGFLASAPPR